MRTLGFLLAVAALAACGKDPGDVPPRPDLSVAVEDMAVDLARPTPPECNLVAQSGCDGGTHCGIGQRGGGNPNDVCVPDPMLPIPPGGPCGSLSYRFGALITDACAPGGVCADTSYGSFCLKPCFLHADCPDTAACIALTSSPTTKNSLPTLACVPSEACDPVALTGCPLGMSCILTLADDVAAVTRCVTTFANLLPGARCQLVDDDGGSANYLDCAPGTQCSAATGACRRLCYAAGPTDGGAGGCPATEGTCSTNPNSAVYGYCQ